MSMMMSGGSVGDFGSFGGGKVDSKNPLGALAQAYSGNPQVASLLSALSSGQDQANNANLAQYKNLINTGNATSKSILGKGGYFAQAGNELAKTGVTARNRIAEDKTAALGGVQQSAVNRGLYNTTIQDSLKSNVGKQAERANQELDSTLAGQKAQLQTQQAGAAMNLGNMNMNAILSRVNEGPQIDQYLSLIQQLMQGGAGQSHPTLFSNAGAFSAANKPVQFSSSIGQQAPQGMSRPGDTYFSGGSAANNPSYSQGLLEAMAVNKA